MSINSRIKAIQIIGQRKAFCRQTIPESSCTKKETVDRYPYKIKEQQQKNYAIY